MKKKNTNIHIKITYWIMSMHQNFIHWIL